jgi:Fic family protein
MALARLSAVAGLVPSVDWLLYSAIRKEALMTSQIEGTQATLTDLFDDEAGLVVSNTDDVEEVTNYLQAFRLVQDNLREPGGPADQCAPAVQCAPPAAQRRARHRQAAG